MVKFVNAALISALTLVMGSTAWAGTPMPVEMSCPIGGKKFTHIETTSYSRWGSRPDGKPYGSWVFPMPIPECPDNGLVLYRKFTNDEIKVLKPLIRTPEFTRLLGEASYYRAAWLMRALKDGQVIDSLWMIAQASWQVDEDPERKARYQREFAEGVEALPAQPENLDWIVMQGRAANAWRELGEFDRAATLLKRVPLDKLDVQIPAEAIDGTTPSGLGKVVTNYGDIQAAKNKRAWLSYFKQLEALIARSDRSSEPIDMIPVRVAASKCMAMERSGNVTLDPFCSNEAVKEQIGRFRAVEKAMQK